MTAMTHHLSALALDGETPTKESGRGMHASTAETPERIMMNTTILPPTPVTATPFKFRRDVAPPPFDTSALAVVWRYVERQAIVELATDRIEYVMDRRLIVSPRKGEIVVEIFDGATVGTLVAVDMELRLIREEGLFASFPWRETASENHPGTSTFSVVLGTPTAVVADPDLRDRIVPCLTAGCDENGRHHTEDLGEAPTHRQVISTGNGYRVHLWLDPDASDEPRWETYVDADELNPETASALADDLQRAALEAEKLNAPLSLSPALARSSS